MSLFNNLKSISSFSNSIDKINTTNKMNNNYSPNTNSTFIVRDKYESKQDFNDRVLYDSLYPYY
ncbi:hypothetical protein DDB_G0273181 [Dictyostelium discoideum AX4]|uniref:Uncharacterized protein n=1 Tax=Dictyostelium discoideum TaxID=44689 RepID=Q556U9_DICDI|nr:hypothetical protein DDB_G0273807 [Dictyostelium discoideum AX4]XP_644730.1 hypothetical protein DDB_G0273181 [Dictyostelium discoideum AX4]EAL70594.1 hypothetical protein DDB_G0273807 [Dictyostelium discoideum AX4]EAL70808.1 hypothetical protein DDB_G0273181 [Dictyostelium discoideum AX4]|eukprot:XP_644520.1 hypothetical protein DDB_G0273807 [Dictyostelium discoideum AX4]